MFTTLQGLDPLYRERFQHKSWTRYGDFDYQIKKNVFFIFGHGTNN